MIKINSIDKDNSKMSNNRQQPKFNMDQPPNLQNVNYFQEFPPIGNQQQAPNLKYPFRRPYQQVPNERNLPKDLFLFKTHFQQRETKQDTVVEDASSESSSESLTELKRKWMTPHQSFSKSKSEEWKVVFEDAMKALQENQHNGAEVSVLIKKLQPPRAEFEAAKTKILNDLMVCLRGLNFNKVCIFGSAHTGLDFHGKSILIGGLNNRNDNL